MQFLLTAIILFCTLLATGCGGGSDSGQSSPPVVVPSPEPRQTPTSGPAFSPVSIEGDITISGHITFDLVPHNAFGGLEYTLAAAEAVRGVTVQLMDATDSVIRQSKTDNDGFYSIGAPPNAQARVVVLAEYYSDAGPQWDFAVVDNTEADSLYLLADTLALTTRLDETRDIHAESGWNRVLGEFDDEAHRPAAPFAVLHAVYQVVSAIAAADDSFVLPACTLNWSYRNKASAGDVTEGYVGTSYYDVFSNRIYILGDAYNDTDEYDFSVIQHELGHFFEDGLSRSDSIGGSHGLSSKLDMRVAFSEGFSNALTALVSGEPNYMDSAGTGLFDSFRFNLEDNLYGNAGWYNENSIGKVLYDLADSHNESGDALSLGFSAIYDVMTADGFIHSDALGSIFLFSEIFREQQPTAVTNEFKSLLASEAIYGTDRFGLDESNDGGDVSVLPIYSSMVQGETIEACSSNRFSEANGLGVNRFIRLSITNPGSVQFRIERVSGGSEVSNPNARLYKNRRFIAQMISSVNDLEVGVALLSTGEHVLEIFDKYNADEDSSLRNPTCFNVSVI